MEQESAVEKKSSELQRGLSLTEGPLLRAALFDLGDNKPNQLLLIIHHLITDGVSWRILIEDLQTAYEQLSRGEKIKLPPKTTSFKQWAERLIQYGDEASLKKELDYWAEQQTDASSLPLDFPDGDNTVGSGRGISLSLSVTETQSLLREVPEVYHTQINDVLLTALAQSFSRWTGERSLLVKLEGHGREPLFEGVDLSRTVGWFTVAYPVRLDLYDCENPGESL
jgi:NRPS condensation-like uncharacterized protein